MSCVLNLAVQRRLSGNDNTMIETPEVVQEHAWRRSKEEQGGRVIVGGPCRNMSGKSLEARLSWCAELFRADGDDRRNIRGI
jgi:hypothetical protein